MIPLCNGGLQNFSLNSIFFPFVFIPYMTFYISTIYSYENETLNSLNYSKKHIKNGVQFSRIEFCRKSLAANFKIDMKLNLIKA